uniref:Uncharacterized protein n=1 Tax=Arundo donax TaxID=35708 RepID=A0A0A8YF13_ARUDO
MNMFKLGYTHSKQRHEQLNDDLLDHGTMPLIRPPLSGSRHIVPPFRESGRRGVDPTVGGEARRCRHCSRCASAVAWSTTNAARGTLPTRGYGTTRGSPYIAAKERERREGRERGR